MTRPMPVPGVYVEPPAARRGALRLAEGGVAAFVGRVPALHSTAGDRVQLHRPTTVDSPARYRALFGRAGPDPIGDAVLLFFNHGGRLCRVVPTGMLGRDEPGDADQLTGLGVDTGQATALAMAGDAEGVVAALGGEPAPDGGVGGRRGMRALEDDPQVELVLFPDLWTDRDGRPSPAELDRGVGVLAAAGALALLHGSLIVLADAPPEIGTDALLAFREKLGSQPRVALYHPWVQIARNGGLATVPPSGAVAGRCSDLTVTDGPHRAPANERLQIADLATPIGHTELARLGARGVNCLRRRPGRGVRVWGARTLAAGEAEGGSEHLNVQRVLGLLRRTLEFQTGWAVFEPHDQALRKRLVRDVSELLDGMERRGMFAGDTPEASWFVQCDGANNPPDAVEAGLVVVDVGVAPVRPAEFVLVRVMHHVPEDQAPVGRPRPEAAVSEGPGLLSDRKGL